MVKKKQKRILLLGILSLIFLYPVIYMLVCSVWEGGNTGGSFMGYYEVLLESPGYLVKFWRSLGMCLLISAGQTILSCMAGTAFAKYQLIGKRFWIVVMALFMILPVQVTLLPNYILMEKLGFQPYGLSEFLLHKEEDQLAAEEEYKDKLDDRYMVLAKKFNVEPRKLLSHVLEYRIIV